MDNFWKNLTIEQYFNEWLDNFNRMCESGGRFNKQAYSDHFKEAQAISEYLQADTAAGVSRNGLPLITH